jgi:tRNA guanosine-2'-O-methyltransferase
VDNKDLPPSIKGKLGGPSQHRLATSITSSVLQGVCSVLFFFSLVCFV